jgi:predicted 3-demethylubiquinone-9 3-methyltransferase (glyoxalase superfamily)
MAKQVRMHLMFDGTAEAAMNFYVDLFQDAKVNEASYYEEGDHKGKVKRASFTLAGTEFICIDTPVKHEFGFTPATSIYVDCESDDEIDRLFSALSDGGQVFMPLGSYGFSTKFGWVGDRFGVSWQLNLP